jgi:hypothetical protein
MPTAATDLPERYGKWKIVYSRFANWQGFSANRPTLREDRSQLPGHRLG